MNPVAALYALQEFDLRLASTRAAIADIDERLGESDEVGEARDAVERCRQEVHEAERTFKERESEADALRSKMEPVERSLYGGTAKNPKELEDLQRDLESLRRRRGELEDRALEAMETLEQAQSALAEAERSLDDLTRTHGAEQAELRDRRGALEGEAEALAAERGAHAEQIESRLLRLYDELASTRQGRAVAKVAGGACQGCRISLPMHLVQRARSSTTDVIQCSSCQRILYVS